MTTKNNLEYWQKKTKWSLLYSVFAYFRWQTGQKKKKIPSPADKKLGALVRLPATRRHSDIPCVSTTRPLSAACLMLVLLCSAVEFVDARTWEAVTTSGQRAAVAEVVRPSFAFVLKVVSRVAQPMLDKSGFIRRPPSFRPRLLFIAYYYISMWRAMCRVKTLPADRSGDNCFNETTTTKAAISLMTTKIYVQYR